MVAGLDLNLRPLGNDLKKRLDNTLQCCFGDIAKLSDRLLSSGGDVESKRGTNLPRGLSSEGKHNGTFVAKANAIAGSYIQMHRLTPISSDHPPQSLEQEGRMVGCTTTKPICLCVDADKNANGRMSISFRFVRSRRDHSCSRIRRRFVIC